MSDYKAIVKRIPVIGPLARACARCIRKLKPAPLFTGSNPYWEDRYVGGGTSGDGSYGKLASFKAEVINAFVEKQAVKTVVEFGCGDGNQLTLARYPHYVGIDVSKTAIDRCRKRFSGDAAKEFFWCDPTDANGPQRTSRSDLSLSLDVIYHLVEDTVFEQYMRDLFATADRFVIIYSSNTNENPPGTLPHVRHRRFTDWVQANAPTWAQTEHIRNRYPFDAGSGTGSFADFYVFSRSPAGVSP